VTKHLLHQYTYK